MICLRVEPEVNENDACLGYIDQRERWECEDECVERSGANNEYICGTTGHFTSFAVLLGGSGAGDGCGADDNLITGAWWGDFVLTVAVFSIASFCGIVVILIGTRVRFVRDYIKGRPSQRAVEAYQMKQRQQELEDLERQNSSGTMGMYD